MSDTTDVTSTLAELERKLRELEQELASIGGPAYGTPVQTAAKPHAPTETAGRLVDEEVEYEPVPPRAPVEPPSPPPTAPAKPPPPTQPPPTLPTRPTPPTTPAPRGPRELGSSANFGEPTGPTDAQLASLADLRRFHDRLERFAKELTEDYDALLGRVMSSFSARGPEAEARAITADSPPSQASAFAAGPLLKEPPAPPPAPHEETLFEGRVELGVGPFYDVASLGAFEQRLAELPYVLEVAVRRFEASHAVVDLRLAAPVALVSELRRVLETDFGVRQVAGGRILLTFDDA
jgi:hypothetical protein